jgi:hypothetical protein
MAKSKKSTKTAGKAKAANGSKAKTPAGDAAGDDAKPETPKRGRRPNLVRRTATTMYFREDVFDAFKKRLLEEKKHAYEVVEQCVEVYNDLPLQTLKDLRAACEGEKRTFREIVEDALVSYLKKRKTK